MGETRATEHLSEWLEISGKSQSWLAQVLGVHQTAISRWLRGAVPSVIEAAALEGVTGTKCIWWGESPTKPKGRAVP
jgi:hypothetical protein